jgi:hypothetical protein
LFKCKAYGAWTPKLPFVSRQFQVVNLAWEARPEQDHQEVQLEVGLAADLEVVVPMPEEELAHVVPGHKARRLVVKGHMAKYPRTELVEVQSVAVGPYLLEGQTGLCREREHTGSTVVLRMAEGYTARHRGALVAAEGRGILSAAAAGCMRSLLAVGHTGSEQTFEALMAVHVAGLSVGVEESA